MLLRAVFQWVLIIKWETALQLHSNLLNQTTPVSMPWPLKVVL